MSNLATAMLLVRNQRERERRAEESRSRNRSGSSFSSSRSRRDDRPDPDSATVRQRTTRLDLPSLQVMEKYSEAEGVELPTMPVLEGERVTSSYTLSGVAQGFYNQNDVTPDDRATALQSIRDLSLWAERQATRPDVIQRTSDSVANYKFLKDLSRRVSNTDGWAKSNKSSALSAMRDAYADDEEARTRFDTMVGETNERVAMEAVIADPSILGTLDGIGLGRLGIHKIAGFATDRLGNEDHQYAASRRDSMVDFMQTYIDQRIEHAKLEKAYAEAEKTRPVEQHLVDFADVPEKLKRAATGMEAERIGKDIEAHRTFEEALKVDPAAAFIQAQTRANGRDPGGRWEHMAKRAGDNLAEVSADMAPDTTAPAPGQTPAARPGRTP